MPLPLITAVAAPVAGAIAGRVIGGKAKSTPALPKDLAPMRAQQISLLNYLLGMGPDPRTAARSALPRPYQPQAVNQAPVPGGFFGRMAMGGMVSGPGGPTSDQVPTMLSNGEGVLNARTVQMLGGPEAIKALNQMGMPHMAGGGVVGLRPDEILPPAIPNASSNIPNAGSNLGDMPTPNLPNVGMGGGQVPQAGGGLQTPQQRLESFYGPMGVPTSPLQQQGSGALNSLLYQPTPEQRAAEISLPQLQNNLAGNPSTQAAVNSLMGLQAGAGADVEGRLSQLGGGNQNTQNAMANLLGGDLQQRLSAIGNRPITGNSSLDQILAQLAGGSGAGGNFAPSNVGIAELQKLAGQNAGEATMAALQPMLQRGLAEANQQGGRFGTSNALLRSTALENNQALAAKALLEGAGIQGQAAGALGSTGVGYDALRQRAAESGQANQINALAQLISGAQGKDTSALNALGQLGQNYGTAGTLGIQDQTSLANIMNMLGSNRLQGQQQQGANLTNAGNLGLGQTQGSNQAANVIGQLFGGQGQAERGLAGQAFNAGATETGQNFAAQNNVNQLIQQLLGTAQSATLGGPVINTPSGAQQGADMGNALAQLLMQYVGQQRTGGSTPAYNEAGYGG